MSERSLIDPKTILAEIKKINTNIRGKASPLLKFLLSILDFVDLTIALNPFDDRIQALYLLDIVMEPHPLLQGSGLQSRFVALPFVLLVERGASLSARF